MKKAFWEGFCEGYVKASKYFLLPAITFILGLVLGSYSHPYEQCSRMYNTYEDIMECVWIKENLQ